MIQGNEGTNSESVSKYLGLTFLASDGYRVIKEKDYSVLQRKIKGSWKTIAREINENHDIKITCTNEEIAEVMNFWDFLNFDNIWKETRKRE